MGVVDHTRAGSRSHRGAHVEGTAGQSPERKENFGQKATRRKQQLKNGTLEFEIEFCG